MQKKKNAHYYVLSLPLDTNLYQENILSKTLEQAKDLYNVIQTKMLNHYKFITSSKAYKNSDDKQKRKILNDYKIEIKTIRNGLQECSVFSKYGVIQKIATKYGKYYPLLNSSNIEEIANSCYSAWDKKINGTGLNKGKLISFKNENDTISLRVRSKKNILCGISFNDEVNIFKLKIGNNSCKKKYYLDIPMKLRYSEYEKQAIQQIKNKQYVTVSITKTKIRGTFKYKLNIGIEGYQYNKKRTIGNGKVGIDIGVNSVTSYGNDLDMSVLSPNNVKKEEIQLKKLDMLIERSRRINNPNYYNDDGTIKRLNKGEKRIWYNSKNYMKYCNLRKEIYRKYVSKRTIYQNNLANHILTLGDIFNIEKNNIKAMSKRKKKTEINEKTGRYKSKKQHGKIISNYAPSNFINILKYKVKCLGGVVNEIDNKIAASQFDFTNGMFTKHKLSERNIILSNGNCHKRDAIASFNLKHCIDNIKTEKIETNFNITNMFNDYDNFCRAEREEIKKHITNKKDTVNAMGI